MIFRYLWDLFFPRCCAVCGRELLANEKHLCLECYAGLPLTYFWNIKDNPAEVVFWGRTLINRVYVLFYYVNNYRKPLHLLKYKSNIGIGVYFGEMLGRKILGEIIEKSKINIIVPVPLHWRKKMKRGYNQAHIIAKGIAFELVFDGMQSKIYPNLLRRKQFTGTQTQKDRIHRWNNVAAAFEINHKVLAILRKEIACNGINNLHILLVDDVLTTGATLEVCANILHEHLNCQISIATLAYVE